MLSMSAAAGWGLWLGHGEILIQKKKQGLIFIETWKYAQQYLVFGTYYLLSKSCYNLFMI